MIKSLFAEPSFVLDHFEVLQQFPVNASHIEMLDNDLLSIWHTSNEGVEQVDTYEWQQLEYRFKHNPSKWAIMLLYLLSYI